jgi:hypothetical protein
MMFVYGMAMVSAPGAAQGSFFDVPLITRVVPRVVPLQACVGRVIKDVVLRPVKEVVQIQVERW